MKIKNNELSKKELKQIAEEAIDEIEKKEKLTSKRIWHPISYVEYYNSDFFKQTIKLYSIRQRIKIATEPLKLLGVNHSYEDTNDEEIFIFLDKFTISKRIKKNTPHQLVDLLNTIHHEFRHSHQREKQASYNLFERLFISEIETYIMDKDRSHYQNNHDEYLMEIDADLFSVKQTEEFLKKYPEIYDKEKNYMDGVKNFYQFEKINYDSDKIWEKFYQLYKVNTENTENNEIINIFINKNTKEYNSIRDICNNKNISLLDEKTFCRILSSKSFLEQINIENLEETEIEILRRTIKYRLEEEEKAKRYNIKRINEDNYIKDTYLLNKILENKQRIQYLNNYLSELQLRNTEIIINNRKR